MGMKSEPTACWKLLAATGAVLALAVGCGGDPERGDTMDDSQGKTKQEKVNELAKRPDIEVAIDKQKQLEKEIQKRLSDELGLPNKWESSGGESESVCSGDYENIYDAIKIHMPSWANVDQPIPEGDWPRALEIFTEVTSRYGYDKPKAIVDSPNDHSFRVVNEYGAQVTFGSKKATALYSITGCHLTQQAHPGRNKSSASS